MSDQLEGKIAYKLVVSGRTLPEIYYATQGEIQAMQEKHGANNIRVIGPYKKPDVTVTRSQVKPSPNETIQEMVERRRRKRSADQ